MNTTVKSLMTKTANFFQAMAEPTPVAQDITKETDKIEPIALATDPKTRLEEASLGKVYKDLITGRRVVMIVSEIKIDGNLQCAVAPYNLSGEPDINKIKSYWRDIETLTDTGTSACFSFQENKELIARAKKFHLGAVYKSLLNKELFVCTAIGLHVGKCITLTLADEKGVLHAKMANMVTLHKEAPKPESAETVVHPVYTGSMDRSSIEDTYPDSLV